MRRRRHRHRRSWARRVRESFTGFGVVFVLAFVVAAAFVWTVLPAVDVSFSAFTNFLTFPDAASLAELQRKAKER